MIEFDGQHYRDDRMFVLHVARCRLDPPDDGMATTTIYHQWSERSHLERDPQSQFLWCVVTYRNTERYPAIRVDHFRTQSLATRYAQHVEPETPLISHGGRPLDPIPSPEEWQLMKERGGWYDYDYREIYPSHVEDPRELVLSRADDVNIFAEG